MKAFALLTFCLALCACTNDFEETPGSAPEEVFPGQEKIVNMPDGASAGVLAVEFSDEAIPAIEQGATRSENTRTGIEPVDLSLDAIDASHFMRLFTDPPFEDRLRAAGLHKWYMIFFDDAVELQTAARKLCGADAVASVEYMHSVRRPFRRPVEAAPEAGFTRAAAAPQNDPGLNRQWHYNNTGSVANSKAGADIGLFDAWEICSGDESIVVAVIDEPVDLGHEDIAANLWTNTVDTDPKLQHGGNFCTYSSDPIAIKINSEYHIGHGMHVAGTVAAVNGNGKGVCGVAGGRNGRGGVKIMSCQIFSAEADPEYPGYPMDYPRSSANALIWAADRGAHIAQCSFGYDPSLSESQWKKRYKYEMAAIDYFIDQPRPSGPIDGGLVIFAAGNDGNSQYGQQQVKDLPIPPGSYNRTISVAATSPDYLPAVYTCYGRWVDISAPGGDSEFFGDPGMIYSTIFDNKYGYEEGTSMACPHVSGVAALGLSYAAKLGKRYTADEFRNMLLASTDYIDDRLVGTKFTDTGWNYDNPYGGYASYTLYMDNYKGKMGGGQVNAYKMLMQVEGTPVMTVAVGRETEIPLTDVLGGAAWSDLTILDGEKSAEKLGMTYTKSGASLKVTCTKSGAAKLTLQCTIGETAVEREVAIVAREAVASNGGWL